MLSVAKIYTYLPKFTESSNQENKLINMLKVKSNIMNAYAYTEEENWNKISEEIVNAETNYMNILNSVPENENSIYNVNKGYILLKELQVALSTKDKDVFYLKYKNLMVELNILT